MKQEKKAQKNAQQLLEDLDLNRASPTDPLGSYTGRPEHKNAKPVQDADDL